MEISDSPNEPESERHPNDVVIDAFKWHKKRQMMAAEFSDALLFDDYGRIVEKARNELEKYGITEEQKEAHSVLSEYLYKKINPSLGYNHNLYLFIGTYPVNESTTKRYPIEDAVWKLYLGINLNSEERKFFGISDYRPLLYKTDAPYFYTLPPKLEEEILHDYLLVMNNYKKYKEGFDKPAASYGFSDSLLRGSVTELNSSRVVFHRLLLGNHDVRAGVDEKGHFIEYHDIWDLDPEVLGIEIPVEMIAGKPIEFFNRIYFDPEEDYKLPLES